MRACLQAHPIQPPGQRAERVEPVWICHATSSETNPYVLLPVLASAWDSESTNGHLGHEGDFEAEDGAATVCEGPGAGGAHALRSRSRTKARKEPGLLAVSTREQSGSEVQRASGKRFACGAWFRLPTPGC